MVRYNVVDISVIFDRSFFSNFPLTFKIQKSKESISFTFLGRSSLQSEEKSEFVMKDLFLEQSNEMLFLWIKCFYDTHPSKHWLYINCQTFQKKNNFQAKSTRFFVLWKSAIENIVKSLFLIEWLIDQLL